MWSSSTHLGYMPSSKLVVVLLLWRLPLDTWHLLPIKSHPIGHFTTVNLAASRFSAQRHGTLIGAFHSTLHGSQDGSPSCFVDSDIVCRHLVWGSSAATSPCNQPSLRRHPMNLRPAISWGERENECIAFPNLLHEAALHKVLWDHVMGWETKP